MKISRRRLVDYVKSLHQKACRTCSTIIFPHSINQIIDLWRCRRFYGRHFLNSLLFQSFGTRWVLDANMTLSRTTKSDSVVEKTNGMLTTASISSLQSSCSGRYYRFSKPRLQNSHAQVISPTLPYFLCKSLKSLFYCISY